MTLESQIESLTTNDIDPATRRAVRRTVVGGAVGSIVEFYEFSTYGVLATTLAVVFFPSTDSTASLLATLAVFAVAFFARPLGGFVWGSIGDRIGRKRTLALTIILMSVFTTLMGIVPGYAAIGVIAPILIIALRFLQGVAAGGEVSGAVSFVAEHSPARTRGFNVGMITVGAGTGTLLGTIVPSILLLTLTPEQMTEWGWRIPLLIALPLGIIGLYIRRRLDETPYFLSLAKQGDTSEHPIRSALSGSRQWRLLITAFLITALNAASFYMLAGYLPTFARTSLELTGFAALAPVVIAVACAIVAEVIAARISDRVGRKRVLMVTAIGHLVLALPCFLLITSGQFGLIVLGLVILSAPIGGYAAVTNSTLIELFPTRVRVSGHGITYNLSVAIFGGAAPYLLTWLTGMTGSMLVGAFYLMALAVIAIPVLLSITESAGKPLRTE
ncbi:MFS transporter [Herbiconiux sp. KACC 21604]|uniref:MFS transporter n=1 Tax=unclassified Herbiconiux TaxID=2618217 RepID=UPI001492A4C0|nr:MFS transporter [Herbiconiux sp. SALV-R1]QJU55151.1 MFS transporter [Herbiconiux sp. SALV-R1]WPO86306.1 MFS transporter [Herbiconiux sp. KACC 21604]